MLTPLAMSLPKYIQSQRPRELRRRVALPARLRSGIQWSDTCILNISSRGLMIHSGRAAPKGSLVELRRGQLVIVARVVWRDGARVGLQSDERLPIAEIMSVGHCGALHLVACSDARIERRNQPRQSATDARLRARALEFVGVGAIAFSIVLSVWAMAQQAFALPLAQVEAALGS
jgi:hypothetical protein